MRQLSPDEAQAGLRAVLNLAVDSIQSHPELNMPPVVLIGLTAGRKVVVQTGDDQSLLADEVHATIRALQDLADEFTIPDHPEEQP